MVSDRRLLYLLQRATRAAVASANARTTDRLGVSVAQLATLSYVAKHPGCRMTDIADVLDLNKSAMSGMIARLERAKLLKREPNAKDGRGSQLYLTERGERVRSDAQPVFRRSMADMTDGFTPAEMEVVFRFLNALVERCSDDADTES